MMLEEGPKVLSPSVVLSATSPPMTLYEWQISLGYTFWYLVSGFVVYMGAALGGWLLIGKVMLTPKDAQRSFLHSPLE